MARTNYTLLKGDVPAPPGAKVTPADGVSPRSRWWTQTNSLECKLSRSVLHPDGRTPGQLSVSLLGPHVIIALPRLDRVVEIFEEHIVLLRLELVHVFVVLDHVDLSDRGCSNDVHRQLRRAGCFGNIAHQRRSDPEIDDDVVGRGVSVPLADRVQDSRAGELL